MHTNRTENELIIQETPGCLWFLGAFFAVVGGIFLFGAIGGFNNWSAASRWQIAVTIIMGSISLGIGFWTINNAPISKLVIDRTDEKVFLTRRRLFERIEDIFTFEEIEIFCLIEDTDDEGNRIWFFGMDLVDGETIRITSMASHSEEFPQRYVFLSNDFARKALPTCEDILEIKEQID